VLCHHVFRIVEGFLETMQDGRELTYERIMQEAPALRSGEDIARFGESVLARLQAWWKTYPDRSCSRMMDTYFGKHPLHVVLERTAWHPTQHTRQLMLILETLNIEPDRRLTARTSPGSASGQGLGRRKGGIMKKIMVALAIAGLSLGAWAQQRNFDAVQVRPPRSPTVSTCWKAKAATSAFRRARMACS